MCTCGPAFLHLCMCKYSSILSYGLQRMSKYSSILSACMVCSHALLFAANVMMTTSQGWVFVAMSPCRHVAKSGDKDRTARDSGDKAL